MTRKYLDDLTYKIVGAAIDAHKALGPGLLESIYHKCMKQELSLRKMVFTSELSITMNYKGVDLETELRCDFLVEDAIIVELKAVDAIVPVHEAQLLTYMKLLQKPKGILINFNCANVFKEGQRTYVNELFRGLPDE
jgi:GxxExxY protein